MIAILLLLLILFVAIIAFIFSEDKSKIKYLPTLPDGFVNPITLSEIKAIPQKFAYTIYLPLRNLSSLASLEEEALSSRSVLSVEGIRQTFGYSSIPNDILIFLSSIGTVKWISPSGTVLQFEAGDNFFDYFSDQNPEWVISNYPGTDYYGISSLKYLEVPFDLTFRYLNVCNDAGDIKTIREWNSEVGGLNQSVHGYCINFNDLTPFVSSIPETTGLPIGMVEFQILPTVAPRKFAEYQNSNHGTSYDIDHFLNLTKNVAFTEEMNYTEIPFSNFPEINELNLEVSIDAISVYAVRPNAGVWCVNGTLTPEGKMYNSDFIPIIWKCSEIPNSPKVWTSSYGSLSLFPRDHSRISFETRLLSLAGYTLFHSTGDQGPWMLTNVATTSEKYDVYRPDGVSNPLAGDGAISVGAFDYNPGEYFDEYWPMSIVNGNENGSLQYPVILNSAGGFYRGLPNPEWKKEAASQYIDEGHYTSVAEFATSSGIERLSGVEIETGGAIFPDVVSIGKTCYPSIFGNSSANKFGGLVAGTSIASPVMASEVCTIIDQKGLIPCFSKFLYRNRKDIFNRVEIGRNGIYNYLGYTSLPKGGWDPVQGLGILNYSKVLELLN